MKSRIVILFICFVIVWCFILVRAAFIQIFPHQELSKLQKRQFERVIKVRSSRGTIYDRKGVELAVSVPAYSLYVDPALVEDPYAVAKRIGPIINLHWKKLYNKIYPSKKRFVWISRKLNQEKKLKIENYGLKGLGFVEEAKRVYPNGRLLSQVLGFVGLDNQGLAGLEYQLNDHLQGEIKKVNLQRDARGRPLINEGFVFSRVPEGENIILTIDSELQYFLEKQLKEVKEKFSAEQAVGIVLDAKTSEVLAMSSIPDFDPNFPFLSKGFERKNRAVTDSFEPGSTMKTFVIASALNRKLIQPNSLIDCEEGFLKIGKRTIKEADRSHKFGHLMVSDVLMKSSNIGIAKIAFDLGANHLRQSLNDFGFGEKTQLGFPGESKGILLDLPWRKHLLSNISFGHGVAATSIQIANAYAAIANKGYYKTPTLVKKIGQFEANKQSESYVKILNDETVKDINLILTGVTAGGGTGAAARIDGYPVAGKTGTAQKVDPNGRGYLLGSYLSSFVGYVPANDPQFVVYVMVDDPKKVYYGSEVAAPVFSKVASFALRKKGVAPVTIAKNQLIENRGLKSIKKTSRYLALSVNNEMPSLEGLSVREVLTLFEQKPYRVKISGSGFVKKTYPKAGSLLTKNQEIKINLSRE